MSELYRYDMEEAARWGRRAKIAGIDEAGRGPLAGPVVAAAVILDLNCPIDGVNDSKKLTAAKRDRLFELITGTAKAYGVGVADQREIDGVNILQATFLAMRRALEGVGGQYDLLLVDGNRHIAGISRERQRTIVGGDALSASIAAASIIAKVTRDRMMDGYHERYPRYDFAKHKGYGTKRHIEMIKMHGLCEIHRKSFCERIVNSQTSLFLA
ncbi:MAG: ribonuclease HII [Chitinispirillales bacterium]|nr:ribonuclease HII [Chitinispirillales bacterium]